MIVDRLCVTVGAGTVRPAKSGCRRAVSNARARAKLIAGTLAAPALAPGNVARCKAAPGPAGGLAPGIRFRARTAPGGKAS